MTGKPLTKVNREEAEMVLKAGGCPANNTKCGHLRLGACTYSKPDLYRREGGYACGSYGYVDVNTAEGN